MGAYKEHFDKISGPGIIAIRGRAAYGELLNRIDEATGDRFNRQTVLVLGHEDYQGDLAQSLIDEETITDGDDPKIYWPQGDQGTELTLSSKADMERVAHILNQKFPDGSTIKNDAHPNWHPIKTLVLLYQDGLCDYLPELVNVRFPELTVYAVQEWLDSPEPLPEEAMQKTYFGEDGKELPTGVDLDAEPLKEEGGIPAIPMDAMYGKAYELARSLETSFGLAYPAVLASACGFGIPANSTIRPTLYVGLLGDVGDGKSVTRDRAIELFFGPEDARDARWIYKVPASDQGLYKILDAEGKTRLIDQDEMRNLLLKGAIENSSLVSVLCQLFNMNFAGGADKKTSYSINVKLSLLGCLKIANPAEFPSVFGFATAHGLYDRCIFGVQPDGDFRYKPWTRPDFDFKPSTPSVSADVFEEVNAWGDKKDKRLRELILRVAYVTAAINGDDYVSSKALFAARRFIEWQKQLRIFYQPAKGANEHQECVEAIEDAFGKAPGMCGNWRQMSIDGHWYRRFPRVLPSVKKLLESQGVLVYHKTTKKHYLAEGAK